MKIVHVLPSLARGGGERLTIELANRQVEAGHKVALILGSDLPAEQIHGGLDPRVEIHAISSAKGRSRYGRMLPWIWRRKAWIAGQDVLHCHLTYGALFGSAFLRLAGPHRPAIVETYHAVGMPISPALKWLHARLATQWDGLTLMADDSWWRDFSRRHPDVVFRIIPVGVAPPSSLPAERRKLYRQALGIPKDARVVATVGRLVAERRPRAYVPVFERIAKLIPDVHFLMGGDGPERSAIESDADSSGIRDRLHLTGLVREIELPLAISDVYVTANVGSVPGVAGLQAVAAGLPVIAMQLREDYSGGAADWIWSSNDPDAIAARAMELISSPEAAGELTDRQARHLRAHHSAEAMAANYDLFYRDAIQAKVGSGKKLSGSQNTCN
jgi:glycosyltransferase involved in cell wall biosynthesis